MRWLGAREDGAALAIGIPQVMVWWALLTACGAFLLARMRVGNWILAVGGDEWPEGENKFPGTAELYTP